MTLTPSLCGRERGDSDKDDSDGGDEDKHNLVIGDDNFARHASGMAMVVILILMIIMMITSGMISERTRRSTRLSPRALVSFIFSINSYYPAN